MYNLLDCCLMNIAITDIEPLLLLPPWQRRLCFWWCWFVCLFVCLSVSGQHYSKSYERIGMKF